MLFKHYLFNKIKNIRKDIRSFPIFTLYVILNETWRMSNSEQNSMISFLCKFFFNLFGLLLSNYHGIYWLIYEFKYIIKQIYT